jgi:hypothetical protein
MGTDLAVVQVEDITGAVAARSEAPGFVIPPQDDGGMEMNPAGVQAEEVAGAVAARSETPGFVIPPQDGGGMETNPAVVEAESVVDASVAAFMAVLTGQDSAGAGQDASGSVSCGADGPDDPLQRLVDGALDVLAAVGRSDAKIAAVKALAGTVVAEGT